MPADIGRATVVGTGINVRSEPSTNASLVTKVNGGEAAIVAQKGDWYKLRFQYGTQGWVREDFLKIAGKSGSSKMIPIKLDSAPVVATKTTPSKQTKSASSGDGLTRYVNLANREVNIRRGPSTSNSSAGRVKGGRALVVDRWNEWYKVKFQYGTIGWVRKDFLEFPSNFDFKNEKNKPVIQTKPETVVASKTPASTGTKENTVEIVGDPEVKVDPDSGPKNATQPIVATVMGDGINVRRGNHESNSVIRKVNGGKAEIIEKGGDWFKLRFPGGTVGWVHEKYVSFPGHEVAEPPKTIVAEADSDLASKTISSARSFTGVRYVYGASSRASTDCSGFVLQVFRSVGFSLPRTAREQATRGTRVGRWDLKMGDLVFFNTRGYISHVGIYIGDSKFIHASSGGHRVMESSLNEQYYSNRFLFGKRILPASKVKKLELPGTGDLPVEKQDQRQDNDNRVDLSNDQKDGKKDEPSVEPEEN